MSNETTGSTAGNSTQGAGAAAAGSDATRGAAPQIQTPHGPTAAEMENGRIQAIENMCQACSINDESMKKRWITSGASLNDVSDDIMRIVKRRQETSKKEPASALGLSNGEQRRFSIVRAIIAAADGNWKDAGFEAECSREISKRLNTVPDAKKFYIPYDVQERAIDPRAISSQQRALNLQGAAPWQTRADTVASSSAGGYLVETVNVGFIELLRNRSVCYRMGAQQLSGLVGNVNVPKQTAAGTAYWLSSETTQITEAEQTFGQMALTPHTVGAYTEISRLLLLQSSPGVEGIVNSDLAAVAALAIDSGGLTGTGSSGQPTGIKNASGVGTAASGDMSTIAYKGQLDYQVAVANANVVPVRGGYVTTPTVAALLMQRTRFANTATPLWDGNLWDANGALGCAGFPGMSTNQMPASAMYFGDWEKLVIAEWGVLEIEVNPYANFQAGIIGIRAMMTIDVGLRYPAAFCIQGANIT
jgi:HK97 family phage major capsid protein